MIRKITDTGYGQKLLFNEILSDELGSCRYRIDAFFEWKNKAQILSLKFVDEGSIELGINLGIKKEPLFADCELATELGILYRAYFISSYIHCLERAAETMPRTFFQGLVVLESIKDIHSSGKVLAHSPLLGYGNRRLRPIDAHCAIHALTRILIGQKSRLTVEAQKRCESAIDRLVHYTRLPEIEYNSRSIAEYAILKDLLWVQEYAAAKPELLARYAIFDRCGILSFEDKTLVQLLADDRPENCFWAEAAMRLLAISEEKAAVIDVSLYPHLQSRLKEYHEACVACFSEYSNTDPLLRDNMAAVKRLSGKLERVFINKGNIETGALHFLQ